ncbi:hypothetical protein BO226_25175 (plasmid) [Rhodococcus sp. 2G]|nr:hypothetical protein BO226_25175 [Rhodococcus sp. 2G]
MFGAALEKCREQADLVINGHEPLEADMQALRISTDANVSRIDLVEGGRKISDGLRAEIGCQFFDVVSLPDGNGGRIDMWLDDEGMYGVGVNPAASFVARRLAPAVQQFFFGNVVFASSDDEGETIALSDRQVHTILEALAVAACPDPEQRADWVAVAARRFGVASPTRV